MKKHDVRQWADRIGLIGPGICMVILGYIKNSGNNNHII